MKIKILILLLVLTVCPIYAEVPVQQAVQTIPPNVPQNVSFSSCTRLFALNKEKLFYLTLASISANKFIIEEIQTANGYVIFKVNNYRFLAVSAEVDNSNSILKITPCNNVYNFPPAIITNVFKYIDLNLNAEIRG